MTKTEQREYLKKYVESQGTQVGLSIVPLLEDLITSNEEDLLFLLRITKKK